VRIAILHPGEMGAAVAGLLPHEVIWVPAGRSRATCERARAFTPGDPLAADVILSICPPHAALDVARSVSGFAGIYVDANAISPDTARQVRAIVSGADFVDGGIIGPPPARPGSTRLYLTGERAGEVAALFDGTALETREVADASALKLAYAAWSKGSQALLLAARAAAEAYGVGEALDAEWEDLQPRLTKARAAKAEKGWRWVGEMDEIAAAFEAAGLPGGFHRAAAEVYRR
jgi:hypothetical protein